MRGRLDQTRFLGKVSLLLPSLPSAHSPEHLEVGHEESVYTEETDKNHKSGLFTK